MKKLLIILLILASSCSNDSEYELSSQENENSIPSLKSRDLFMGRSMSFEDPNLNPNFEWWNNENHEIHAQRINSSQSISMAVKLPFFNASSRLGQIQSERDMYPEDGWRLVARDFGTSRNPVQGFPFIILYNKFSGQLRYMFFNPFGIEKNHYEVNLSFHDSSRSGALLNGMDLNENNKYLDNYDPNAIISAKAESPALFGWGVADFWLNYDPSLHPESVLKFEINGIDVTETGGSANHELSGTITSNSTNPLVGVFKDFSNLGGFLQEDSDDNSGFNYTEALMTLLGSSNAISFFTGGLLKETSSSAISLSGQSEYTFVSTNKTPQDVIALSLFDDSYDGSGFSYKNLYNGNFGIYNFNKITVNQTQVLEESIQYSGGCDIWYSHKLDLDYIRNNDFIWNPDISRNDIDFKLSLPQGTQGEQHYSGNFPTDIYTSINLKFYIEVSNPNARNMSNKYLLMNTSRRGDINITDYWVADSSCL